VRVTLTTGYNRVRRNWAGGAKRPLELISRIPIRPVRVKQITACHPHASVGLRLAGGLDEGVPHGGVRGGRTVLMVMLRAPIPISSLSDRCAATTDGIFSMGSPIPINTTLDTRCPKCSWMLSTCQKPPSRQLRASVPCVRGRVSRVSPPYRPKEDGLAYPADTSRTNLANALSLLSTWRLSKPTPYVSHGKQPNQAGMYTFRVIELSLGGKH
jgi:hypothetical protein